MRRPLAATLAAVLALAAPAPGIAAEPSASLPDIEDEVMCPICGTTLEQSGSPQAERQRELIRRLIAEGRDKEEIKDRLVVEYGPDVLAEPEGSGFDLAAWLVPMAGILTAVAVVLLVLRRSRRDETPSRKPELGDGDAARLDRDMSRYDL